jgi:uncharacterized membrane protein YfcA
MELSFLATLVVWGIFVGVFFSTIGAAGGILTSFCLISILGLADPNSVKPTTQIITLAMALTFVPGYFRRSALVWPLGLFLAFGGLLGAWVGSSLSSIYLADMNTFRPLFGALTLLIGAQIAWRLYRSRNKTISPQPARGSAAGENVRDLHFSNAALTFSYRWLDYRVPAWSPLLAGFLIAMVAAVFGVGGGFLLVPYMSSLLGLPMHIIPATAGIAIVVSLLASIWNYLSLGAHLEMAALLPLLSGAVLGALAGPFVNRWMKNNSLQAALALIVVLIGLRYILA